MKLKHALIAVGLLGFAGCSTNTTGQTTSESDIPSQADVMRSLQVKGNIRQSGQVSDADLDWLLASLQSSPQPERVDTMVALSRLTQASQSQKDKIKTAIAPFLNSENGAEKKAAEKVQSSIS